MSLRTNWKSQIRSGNIVMDKKQVERVAAVGSFVIVKGGNLYQE